MPRAALVAALAAGAPPAIAAAQDPSPPRRRRPRRRRRRPRRRGDAHARGRETRAPRRRAPRRAHAATARRVRGALAPVRRPAQQVAVRFFRDGKQIRQACSAAVTAARRHVRARVQAAERAGRCSVRVVSTGHARRSPPSAAAKLTVGVVRAARRASARRRARAAAPARPRAAALRGPAQRRLRRRDRPRA